MNESYKSFFRPAIDALSGYTPGEQPKISNLIKLNTNENAYPPSPKLEQAFSDFNYQNLRRYPDPMADKLCTAIAARHGVARSQVIAGNGSDDILTMVFRAFTSPELPVAVLDPTYSLYPTLAAMQEARVIKIALDARNNFAMPDTATLLRQAATANLLIITRPNAPTGNSFELQQMREIVTGFNGIVLFDEAYADFADDNCVGLASEFSNVIVSRTSSKSFALAGLRFGYALAHPQIITGLVKLKDSYNMDMLTQHLATAAIGDLEYLNATVAKVRCNRENLAQELRMLGYKVVPSQANFLFAAPPDGDAARIFRGLRENAIIVRYFPGETTGSYLRITVGLPEQNAELIAVLRKLLR